MLADLQKRSIDIIEILENRAPVIWRRWRERFPRLRQYLPEDIKGNTAVRIAAGTAAAIAFAAGAAIVWVFPYRFAGDDLARLRQQESSLKQTYIKRLPAVPRIDRLQAGQRRANQTLALLRQQLTGDGEQDAVMNEIDTAGRMRGLRFIMFKPGAGPKDGIQISAIGKYRAIARFIDDIAQMPRIVVLDPLILQARRAESDAADESDTSEGLLNLQATAIAIPSNASNESLDNAGR